ncbi:hypothetical protein NFJ02_45g112990 [Pycnococcus provasolii]
MSLSSGGGAPELVVTCSAAVASSFHSLGEVGDHLRSPLAHAPCTGGWMWVPPMWVGGCTPQKPKSSVWVGGKMGGCTREPNPWPWVDTHGCTWV